MNHRKIKGRSTVSIYRCYSSGKCQLLPLLIKDYSLMSSVRRYSQMRSLKQKILFILDKNGYQMANV